MTPLPTVIASTHGYTKVTDFLSRQFETYNDRPLARYFVNHASSYGVLSYGEVERLATNLAFKLSHRISTVVALLGGHDIDYLILLIALMKLQVTIFVISPRNSVAANVDLLEKTRSGLLITSSKLAGIARASAEGVGGVEVFVMESMDIHALLQEPLLDGELDICLDEEDDLNRNVFIFHSSGSTSYPKPIYITNHNLLCSLQVFHGQLPAGTIDATDTLLCCTPLSHIFGFVAVFASMSLGASIVIIQKLPTSQEEIKFALAFNQCTMMTATPILLEEMIPYLEQGAQDFSHVQRLKVVLVGGAPMRRDSGDWFHRHGVKVSNAYGTTEMGPSMTAGLDFSKGWNSMYPFVVDEKGVGYVQFETNDEDTPDIKHCYIRAECPLLAKGVHNRSDGGYSTNDLFREDVTSPGYYIYVGRRDDMLVMENGEKTNPIPIESCVVENSRVIARAVVLGHGRACTAMLVELKEEEEERLSEEEIWRDIQMAVEKANEDSPNHSKLFPQMVKILKAHEHLPINVKGAVIRHQCMTSFGKEVDRMYLDFLSGKKKVQRKEEDNRTVWTTEQVKRFLLECLSQQIDSRHPAAGTATGENGIDQHQSVFDLGLDSISAIGMRNQIAEQFPDIPLNFIFQHQNLFAMCQSLCGQSQLVDDGYETTQALVQKYISKAKLDFPKAHQPHEIMKKKPTVVLLTGATGSLGTFILRDLLRREKVVKIYCLIRVRDGEDMMDRLERAFGGRMLDPQILKTDRIKLLPLRLSDDGHVDPMWGLTATEYSQLKSEVTVVQHCGWVLDFNMPIEYFDKTCIEPFYEEMVKFAYRPEMEEPMELFFISSVSATALWDSQSVPEEEVGLDPSVSLPMGYAQSKYVVEALLGYLRREKNFRCVIQRVGQVCGDTKHGVWNTQEQYPMLIVGGSVMHVMPDLVDTVVDWIPVDVVSACITERMVSPSLEEIIQHIVNPKRIGWKKLMRVMKEAGMRFDMIDLESWVRLLSEDKTNPCYGLLSFFEAKSRQIVRGEPIYWETEKTGKSFSRLNDTPELNVDLFKKFLTHWESVGYYNANV
ncbi:hypothetical protein INT47_000325 [Mucor saturninus]|uniref:Polyketide synthase-like phosphopantetheine-binding domain-containing protein n=1 Tax=Mucor saturninus TaxID=64648 RepID=A0A8H7QX90_9FUNG|nr:hypothetical protein INT47_000325 [Mucor saturninus]